MKIEHYLRFKATDLSKDKYQLVAKSISPDYELLNSNNRIELYADHDLDNVTFILFAGSLEIGEICFPSEKYCYGYLENSQDLIVGSHRLRNSVIELIVIKDQLPYSFIHYQAYKNGDYRKVIKEIKSKL